MAAEFGDYSLPVVAVLRLFPQFPQFRVVGQDAGERLPRLRDQLGIDARPDAREPVGQSFFLLRRERGAALIISMILLVLITLVGVASLRNVLLEEKMAANYYDRSLAFQSAEAGLRAGEAVAVAQASASPKHAQALALRTEDVAADQVPPSHWARGHYFSLPGRPAFQRRPGAATARGSARARRTGC